MFGKTLKHIVDNVEGGIGAVVMGVDGIAVESYTRQPTKGDVSTIGTEFSFIVSQVRKAAEALDVGECQDISVKAENLILVIRLINDQYYLATALAADGNFGKARFLMRMAAVDLVAQL